MKVTRKTFVIVAVAVAILIVGVGAAYMRNRSTNSDGPRSTAPTGETITPETDLPTLQRMARNTQRKAEAQRLLSGTMEFINNNSGQAPTVYAEGELSSPSAEYVTSVKLAYYTTVSVTSGQQEGVTVDQIRLVTDATCGQEGRAVAGSSRSYAVQYGLEQADGSFTSACDEG